MRGKGGIEREQIKLDCRDSWSLGLYSPRERNAVLRGATTNNKPTWRTHGCTHKRRAWMWHDMRIGHLPLYIPTNLLATTVPWRTRATDTQTIVKFHWIYSLTLSFRLFFFFFSPVRELNASRISTLLNCNVNCIFKFNGNNKISIHINLYINY